MGAFQGDTDSYTLHEECLHFCSQLDLGVLPTTGLLLMLMGRLSGHTVGSFYVGQAFGLTEDLEPHMPLILWENIFWSMNTWLIDAFWRCPKLREDSIASRTKVMILQASVLLSPCLLPPHPRRDSENPSPRGWLAVDAIGSQMPVLDEVFTSQRKSESKNHKAVFGKSIF